MTSLSYAIRQQKQRLQIYLGIDLSVPIRPNFRSILPPKPEPFRSYKLPLVDDLASSGSE